jgi:hypothetical protein
MRPIRTGKPFGNPDVIFHGKTYLDRVAIMCERMRNSGLYHLAWVIGVIREPVSFCEPSAEVGWDRFAADLRNGFKLGQAMPVSPA